VERHIVMRTYRAAILGCGRIGCRLDDDPKRRGIWTHAGAYAACARTALAALADVDPEGLEWAGRRWNVPSRYRDLDTMLAHEAIDILSICTPSDSHSDALRRAVSAGVRAIWCEKPLVTCPREGDALLEETTGRTIAVNHTRRWDRAYETARAWLAAGNAGRLRAAAAWYTGGVSNIGSHLFDALRFLLGDPEWVWAGHGAVEARDPTLSGTIGFAGGTVCQVLGCGGDDLLLFEIDLLGDQGRLRVSGNGSRVQAWPVAPSPRYSGYREPAEGAVLWDGEDPDRMRRAVEDIVKCLDAGPEPRCALRDGLWAVEMVAAFLRSAAKGERVELPLRGTDRDIRIPVR
jgi:predicted dehydrogenase